MGLLDGDLTPVVGAAFGWLLLDGTLHRRIDSLVDNGKGGFTETPPVNVPIKCMVDPATEQMRRDPDFNVSDVALLILAQGVPMPTLDDEVTVATGAGAGTYRLFGPINRDAAQTHYVARGRRK